jgi:hypothetical protein
MNKTEKPAFIGILDGTLQLYGRQCPTNVIGIWWSLLEPYPLEDVKRAFTAHLQDPDAGRFAPVPPAILGRIPGATSEYPSADEAWNVCPKDEETGGWMFPEMMVAYSACRWSRDEGDMIGARKCFIEAYNRAVAGKKGRPQWGISDGIRDTQEQREQNRLALMEQHPERCVKGQIEYQKDVVAGLLGCERSNSGESVGDLIAGRLGHFK